MQTVTCAVMEEKGKIFLARRKPGDRLEHKWEFPGGKVEPGETPEQCLKRELREEFGIDVEVGEFLCSSSHAYAHGAITLLAYKTRLVAGAFTLHEHAEIRWVKPEDLKSFDLSEADIPIAVHVKELFAGK